MAGAAPTMKAFFMSMPSSGGGRFPSAITAIEGRESVRS